MKALTTILLTLIVLGGCSDGGYESYDECYLKEIQKCTFPCVSQAKKFCKDEAGNHYTKAHRDSFLQAREESGILLEGFIPRCNECKKNKYAVFRGENVISCSSYVDDCKAIGINIEE